MMPKHPITLATLRAKREEIIAIAEKHGAFNVRVFGSVAREATHSASDVDFLVSFHDGASIFDQVGLWLDLQELLQCEIDLLTDHAQAGRITQVARKEAVTI